MSSIDKLVISSVITILFLTIYLTNKQVEQITILPSENMGESVNITSVNFEVFGIVQGVFFRKHTQKRGKELGLKGWCMNTERGTVQGVMEGEPHKIEEMKRWLQFTGSPMSKIEKAEFRNEKQISKYTFKEFAVRR